MSATLQAIVFDFDGVIANSEPLHLRAFQQTLAEEQLTLSTQEYFSRYLGFDDIGVFAAIGRDRGIPMDEQKVADLVKRKGTHLQQMLRAGEVLFPGAADFIRQAAAVVPIAVASGALLHEIEEILHATNLSPLFGAIVASGDTPESKPSPAPYSLAVERLRRQTHDGLVASRCVAIEDSRWGLESARGAGLRCVGITSSYPASELQGAELIVDGLKSLTIPMLERLVETGTAETRVGA